MSEILHKFILKNACKVRFCKEKLLYRWKNMILWYSVLLIYCFLHDIHIYKKKCVPRLFNNLQDSIVNQPRIARNISSCHEKIILWKLDTFLKWIQHCSKKTKIKRGISTKIRGRGIFINSNVFLYLWINSSQPTSS